MSNRGGKFPINLWKESKPFTHKSINFSFLWNYCMYQCRFLPVWIRFQNNRRCKRNIETCSSVHSELMFTSEARNMNCQIIYKCLLQQQIYSCRGYQTQITIWLHRVTWLIRQINHYHIDSPCAGRTVRLVSNDIHVSGYISVSTNPTRQQCFTSPMISLINWNITLLITLNGIRYGQYNVQIAGSKIFHNEIKFNVKPLTL